MLRLGFLSAEIRLFTQPFYLS